MNKKLVMSIFISIFLVAAFTVSAQTPFVGEFEIQDDSGDGGVSTITMSQGTETIDGKSVTVWTFKGENKLDKYPWAFVNITFKPDAATLDKLKKGKGIQFKASGAGTWNLMATLSNVRDYCYHRNDNLQINAGTTVVTQRYSTLKQPSWGVRIPFNAARLTGIQLTKDEGKLGPFEIKVWDVELID
jgi:hypothetical protein